MREATLIDRYQNYRTKQFLKNESKYANSLPNWRNQRRRRLLVTGLAATFAFMFGVSLLCAFGIQWAPLLWLPACVVFLPLWVTLQIVSGRQGDAPDATLDEYELAQRNSARSIGLTITQYLMMVPVFYLIFGAAFTGGADTDMAYAGGLMALTVLLVGGCSPAMILGWTRPDPEAP
ncbi:hypothetical protein [Mycolicibacterium iranicum]|uniref:Uncharacterized protein n=1 Tax=Mycolicibacterium iranicum TaxID=912594 RepID=A0A178LWM0_MYCIR|nr:hypothetical protein [Mycolicibacterium iranicum]OAN38012.1 hypothetical protein A4X20_20710 [Mycolicibacterium iranicum]